jgi:hypothetical protein
MGGNPLTLAGTEVKAGDPAPDDDHNPPALKKTPERLCSGKFMMCCDCCNRLNVDPVVRLSSLTKSSKKR